MEDQSELNDVGRSPENRFGDVSFVQKIKSFFSKERRKVVIATAVIFSLILLTWAIVSKTSGEIASLKLSPATSSVTAGNDFGVGIRVDTKNNNVVAVKGVVKYNPGDFELVGWSTANSVFSQGNECVFDGKPCEIIVNDPASGKIIITLAKPTPGVKTADGLIANLTFKAKKALAPSSDNITLEYVAFGSYEDSDVIFDDGQGTEILNEVTNSRITSVLPVPTGLSATGFSATQINLSWNNPSSNVGIAGYKIFRNNVEVGTSATNSYQDKNLSPVTSYSYKIQAFDAAGNLSSQTAVVSGTTLADTTKPTVPGSLNATSGSMYNVDLSWTASTDDVGVVGYNIYRNNSKVGTATGTTYKDTGLTPETTYSYTVSAYDAAGNESDKTGAKTATTLSDTEAPSKPNGVAATAVSTSQINLSWSASSDNVGVTGYNIYRNGAKVGTSTTTSYEDKNLTVSTTYSYQISAYDAKGNESAKSNTVQATTNADTSAPTVPGNLNAVAVSMTEVDLSWTASTDNIGVVGYRIFRNGTQVGTSTATTYRDSGLAYSTTYSYTVSAYDAAGNQSAQTAPKTVATLGDTQAPTVPSGVAGSAASLSEINLSWNASTDNIGVTGYNVYRNGVKIGSVDSTEYKDTGLSEGTTYRYRISAYDAAGNESSQSPEISVTTSMRKYGIADFTNLVADWLKTKTSPADVNNDGTVNSRDLGIMMSRWDK